MLPLNPFFSIKAPASSAMTWAKLTLVRTSARTGADLFRLHMKSESVW